MFGVEYLYDSGRCRTYAAALLFVREKTLKRIFAALQISFPRFLRHLCWSFCDWLSFLSLPQLPDGVYRSEMPAWLVSDWLWGPKCTEAIFKRNPLNHRARQARLPGQHTLCELACGSPVLSLVLPCYTRAVTLWICQGNSCSLKYCTGLVGRAQGGARSRVAVITVMMSWSLC